MSTMGVRRDKADAFWVYVPPSSRKLRAEGHAPRLSAMFSRRQSSAIELRRAGGEFARSIGQMPRDVVWDFRGAVCGGFSTRGRRTIQRRRISLFMMAHGASVRRLT